METRVSNLNPPRAASIISCGYSVQTNFHMVLQHIVFLFLFQSLKKEMHSSRSWWAKQIWLWIFTESKHQGEKDCEGISWNWCHIIFTGFVSRLELYQSMLGISAVNLINYILQQPTKLLSESLSCRQTLSKSSSKVNFKNFVFITFRNHFSIFSVIWWIK